MLKKASENKSPSENSVRKPVSPNGAIPTLWKERISSVARALCILLCMYSKYIYIARCFSHQSRFYHNSQLGFQSDMHRMFQVHREHQVTTEVIHQYIRVCVCKPLSRPKRKMLFQANFSRKMQDRTGKPR